MRLDARNGDHGWFVWDCRNCCSPHAVVYVDDVTAEWGQYALPLRLVGEEIEILHHRAQVIAILADKRTVLIDPVFDEQPLDVEREAEANQPITS